MPQMKPTSPSDTASSSVRRFTLAIGCALFVLMAGCGPGTGGTGTGPGATHSFAGPAPSGTALPPATACTAGACAEVMLRVDSASVDLVAPCLRFIADTGVASQELRQIELSGRIERNGTDASLASRGSLRIVAAQELGAAEEVTVTLVDAQGVAVLGPAQLRRQAAADAGPVTCGR